MRGTFDLACPDHDGASDLHAQVVTVTEKGKATPDEFDINAFTQGMVTVMIGLAMMVVYSAARTPAIRLQGGKLAESAGCET